MDTLGLNCSCSLPRNVGTWDRFGRVFLGVVLVGLALLSDAPGAVVGWIGLIPLATGLLGTCYAYKLMGVDTSDKQ